MEHEDPMPQYRVRFQDPLGCSGVSEEQNLSGINDQKTQLPGLRVYGWGALRGVQLILARVLRLRIRVG